MPPEAAIVTAAGGVLPVDKPVGVSSFSVVRAVRRALSLRAAGHAGTLDPLASGLLLVCVGPATRLSELLMEGGKTYRASVRLGVEMDTDDMEGRPTASAPVPALDRATVEAALARFVGEIVQVPPAFSAIKQGGQPLYRRARRGEDVSPEPRSVAIRRIDLLAVREDVLEIEIECGKGTYVRALARDLGRSLDTRGHLAALRRTRCAGFDVGQAIPLEDVDRGDPRELAARLVAPLDALPGLPRRLLSDDELRRVGCGQAVPALEPHPEDATVLLVSPAGGLAAVATAAGGWLRPKRVFPAR
jgi:tRNA pseudouridine55 synthase